MFSPETTIDIGDLADGVYIIKVVTEKNVKDRNLWKSIAVRIIFASATEIFC